jgi:uncharacterized protein (TIGR02246 family)
MSAADVVRRSFEIFQAQDRRRREELLAEGFTFTSPYDDGIDKATYFQRCWPNASKLRGFAIEALIDRGDEAFVQYIAERVSDGVRFRNTEHHRLQNGKLKSIHIYFGRELATPRDVRDVYRSLLDAWNARDARAFADHFTPDGECIGFDGTEMQGAAEIAAALAKIFADHPTARYVSKVRSVRMLGPDTFVLRAVAGMVPPGKNEINPKTNAVQVAVAVKGKLSSFQNTPAAYHGRDEDAAALTREPQTLA